MSDTLTSSSIFWVNLEYYAYQRGWNSAVLATQLGITKYTLRRLRSGQCRYIDPEILASSCEIFELTPNDLLLRKADLEARYALT